LKVTTIILLLFLCNVQLNFVTKQPETQKNNI